MSFGYHGKILHLYLNELTYEIETPGEEFFRTYLGGSALGLYYLLKYSPAKVDSFDPENILTLSVSVVTGAPISGQSRLTATAKSPLTGAVGDSQSGGFFPAELKFAGFEAIVVHGKAENPIYVWIKNGVVEYRSAEHLWGKTTGDVDEILAEELEDPKIEILQTGLAGENLVRYASLISMSNRANGRTGMGAVMGSKNLKAIVVRGKMRPKYYDKKSLNELARWGSKELPNSDVYGLGILGTAEIVEFQNKDGGLPTNNWASGTFEGWKAIDGKTMANTILKKRDSCYACTIRCKRVVESDQGEYNLDPQYGGPEYESLSTLGSYCGVNDLQAVAYANQLCAMYGLDTISCGATIAWAMDCFEKGIINEEDTGGIELRFGNAQAVVELTEKIARREGFGNLLAEGSFRAAEEIGRGSEELVVAVKKQELPAHMPQVKRSLGLIYAVNPFGADHQSHEHDPGYFDNPVRMAEIGLTDPQPVDVLNEEKIKYSLVTQYLYSAMDSINVCQFVFGPSWQLYPSSVIVRLINHVTGWNFSLDDLMNVGKRRLNMMRTFNAQEGFDNNDDILPPKMYQALKGGASNGVNLDEEELERAKGLYYKMAGWDEDVGIPTRETLDELNLNWLADIIKD